MNELIRKGLYTGVGSLALARKKIEELIEDLIQNQELTRDEGRRVIHTVINRLEDEKIDMEQRINGLVDEVLHRLNLPDRHALEIKLSEFVNQFSHRSLFGKTGEDSDKPSVQ